MPEVLISDHARMEITRRDLSEDLVRRVAMDPAQVLSSSSGRQVRQSLIQESPDSRPMLVRVVVIEEGDTLVVITAYRTSRIAKYWQAETNP